MFYCFKCWVQFPFSSVRLPKKKKKKKLPRNQKWKGPEVVRTCLGAGSALTHCWRVFLQPVLKGLQWWRFLELLRQSVITLPLLAIMKHFLMSNPNLSWCNLSLLLLFLPPVDTQSSFFLSFLQQTYIYLKTDLHLHYLFLRLNASPLTFFLKAIYFKFLNILHFASLFNQLTPYLRNLELGIRF